MFNWTIEKFASIDILHLDIFTLGIFHFLSLALSDWYKILITTIELLFFQERKISAKTNSFAKDVETSNIATWEMRPDIAFKGRRDVFICYLSRIATGLICYWTIARTSFELSVINKYKYIFFLINAKEWNADWCHRKFGDQWLVLYNSMRVCRCLHAVITPCESIESPQENKYRHTFNIAHRHNLFTATAILLHYIFVRTVSLSKLS